MEFLKPLGPPPLRFGVWFDGVQAIMKGASEVVQAPKVPCFWVGAGSVRVPASYCGVLGIRPSHGRASLDGACPLAPSFDTCRTLLIAQPCTATTVCSPMEDHPVHDHPTTVR